MALGESLHNLIDAEAARMHRLVDEALERDRIATGAFRLIPREEWGAEHGTGLETSGPKPLAVIHHFASPDVGDAEVAAEEDAIRGVERYHAEKGWRGIGYNFVVCQSGRVYEGRGWGHVGAHTQGHNSSSVGIAFAINASVRDPSERAMAACRALLERGVELGHLAPDFKIRGHRDFAETTCPGGLLYVRLEDLRP